MSSFTVQTLKDTTEKAVMKLCGRFTDGTQENSSGRISASSFAGALNANTIPGLLSSGGSALPFYGLTITRINYSVNFPTSGTIGALELFWAGNTPTTIAFLNGNGELGSEDLGLVAIPNNATTPTGNIGINTYGATANSSYTIIMEIRKDNAYYQRGQFNDPAAFNYGPYSLRP